MKPLTFKSYITSKWKRLTILIVLYTILLTVFFEDDDFTGLIDLSEKVDDIQKREEGEKVSHRQLVMSLFDKIVDRFNFVVITISSVGYGDVVPKSRRLRLVNAFFIILLIYIVYND